MFSFISNQRHADYNPREMKRYVHKQTCNNVLSSLIYKAKHRETQIVHHQKNGWTSCGIQWNSLLSNKKEQTSDRYSNLSGSHKHYVLTEGDFPQKSTYYIWNRLKTNLSWKQNRRVLTWWEWDQGLTWRGIRNFLGVLVLFYISMEVWVTQVYIHLLEPLNILFWFENSTVNKFYLKIWSKYEFSLMICMLTHLWVKYTDVFNFLLTCYEIW